MHQKHKWINLHVLEHFFPHQQNVKAFTAAFAKAMIWICSHTIMTLSKQWFWKMLLLRERSVRSTVFICSGVCFISWMRHRFVLTPHRRLFFFVIVIFLHTECRRDLHNGSCHSVAFCDRGNLWREGDRGRRVDRWRDEEEEIEVCSQGASGPSEVEKELCSKRLKQAARQRWWDAWREGIKEGRS